MTGIEIGIVRRLLCTNLDDDIVRISHPAGADTVLITGQVPEKPRDAHSTRRGPIPSVLVLLKQSQIGIAFARGRSLNPPSHPRRRCGLFLVLASLDSPPLAVVSLRLYFFPPPSPLGHPHCPPLLVLEASGTLLRRLTPGTDPLAHRYQLALRPPCLCIVFISVGFGSLSSSARAHRASASGGRWARLGRRIRFSS